MNFGVPSLAFLFHQIPKVHVKEALDVLALINYTIYKVVITNRHGLRKRVR